MAPPQKAERSWCLCVPASDASLAVGVVYCVVNVAAVLGGLIFLAVTYGTGQVSPAAEGRLLPGVLGACFLCVLSALACVLLVFGARRRRWELVLAWLAWYGLFQTLLTLAWLGGVAHLVHVVSPAVRPHPAADVAFGWRVLVPLLPVGIIVLAFVWYAYAAVVAHFRALRRAAATLPGEYRFIQET